MQSEQSIHTIAELGLIFMLFMIGLEIDLKKIVRAGKVILVTSAAQIFGSLRARRSVLFMLIGLPLGGGRFDALYLAAAVALSSTVIIVKVLYDKFELDTLPGRITLGVLVLQDLFAILFLAIQPSLDNLQLGVALLSVVRVGVLLTTALLISRFTLPHLFQLIARLPELVLVGALAWCFAVAELAALARPVARNGRADRRRVALDLPLRARRHGEGDVAARLLHHAVLRGARHDDPAADRRGGRPCAGHRRIHAGKPAADGVSAALR